MPEKLDDIEKKLKGIEKEKAGEVVGYLKKLVEDWKGKKSKIFSLAEKQNQIIIFDPLKPELKEIITKITHEDRKLDEPYKHIRYGFSEKTKLDLSHECKNLELNIKKCF